MSDRLDRYQEPTCTEVICVCGSECDWWTPVPFDETLGACSFGVTGECRWVDYYQEGTECPFERTVDVWS